MVDSLVIGLLSESHALRHCSDASERERRDLLGEGPIAAITKLCGPQHQNQEKMQEFCKTSAR